MKTNNVKMKRLGDFLTRAPKKDDFTEYIYEFADGDKVVIQRNSLSKEWDDILFEEYKKEVNNNRVQIEDHRAYSKDPAKHEAILHMQESMDCLEDLIIENLDNQALKEALWSLDPIEREIIYGKYFADKANTTIARELGVSEGQIRYKLPQIITKIKNKF